MTLTIISWNVLYTNENIPEKVSQLLAQEPDILTLQEVPEHALENFKALPYHMVSVLDWSATTRKPIPGYLVTLSKHPIVQQDALPIANHHFATPRPWRTHLPALIGWGNPVKDKHALITDIDLGTHIVRICNVHLELFTPKTRREDFDTIVDHAKSALPIYVCGDFNLLELPHITLLNWLAGGRLTDWLLWWRERRTQEKRFTELSLYNPLRGHRTQKLSLSQLDHILVPKTDTVIRHTVLTDSLGSDHYPILVELQ